MAIELKIEPDKIADSEARICELKSQIQTQVSVNMCVSKGKTADLIRAMINELEECRVVFLSVLSKTESALKNTRQGFEKADTDLSKYWEN